MSRLKGASFAALLVTIVAVGGLVMLFARVAQGHENTTTSFSLQQAAQEATHTILPTATEQPTSTPTTTPFPTPTARPTATPIPTDTPPDSELGASIDRYVSSLVDAKLFHGAVLVARRGQVLLNKGYGPADIDRDIANTGNTRFRVASLTKQFTAMAIMQLVAAEKLAVDDPICQYIDDCPKLWSDITIRHLLNHTHGLPNYTDFPSYESTQMETVTVQQLLERLRGQWPVSQPGSEYAYGNTGYVLLGAIIEKVSGQSYGAFLHDHIFAPLGMDNSGVTYAPEPGTNWALPYESFSYLAKPLDTTTLYASGALYSTVSDLYRWDQALYGDKLLPQALLTEMFTPALNRYGFGWKIINDDGHLRYSHPGEMDGCRTVILRYPNDEMTVIVLANMQQANADGIAAYIAQVVFDS